MPENSWRKVNQNTFASVLQPASLRPTCTSISGPNAIINAWGGFAYDTNRGDVITFGGGHGDYCGNDVYRFRLSTSRWERAGISSQMTVYQKSAQIQTAYPKDGFANAPATAHMYDGLMFLTVSDRLGYFDYGASEFSGTGAPTYTGLVAPRTGPWFFDPAKSDPNKVVGSSGSAVDPSIAGGRMWENREYATRHPSSYLPSGYYGPTISTDAVCEAGKDVIYVRTSGPSTVSSGLVKYVVSNISNPDLDQLTHVGANGNHISEADMAVDTNRLAAVVVGDSTRQFVYWDLARSGASNPMQAVNSVQDLTGGFNLRSNAGMDFDPARDRFLLWNGESDVWELRLPATLSPSGWTVRRIASSGGASGALAASGGAKGKWKYAPGIDVFLGMREAPGGDVWIYKPTGWRDPAL